MEFNGRYLRNAYLYTSGGVSPRPNEFVYLPIYAYSESPVIYAEGGTSLEGLGAEQVKPEQEKNEQDKTEQPMDLQPNDVVEGKEIISRLANEELSDQKEAEQIANVKKAKQEAADLPDLKIASYVKEQEGKGVNVNKRLSKSPERRNNKKFKFEPSLQFD
jgi:hypothetical protein